MTLFQAFLRLKNIFFWESKTSVFKAVCETQKPWFAYIYIYIYIYTRKSSFFESSNSFQEAVFETQKNVLLSITTAQKRYFVALFKLLFNYFLVMTKSRNRLTHCKTNVKQAFFRLKNRLKKDCFWSFKRAVFESVFESQKRSLVLIVF